MLAFVEKLEELYNEMQDRFAWNQCLLFDFGRLELQQLTPFKTDTKSKPCLQDDLTQALTYFRNYRMCYPDLPREAVYIMAMKDIKKIKTEKDYKQSLEDLAYTNRKRMALEVLQELKKMFVWEDSSFTIPAEAEKKLKKFLELMQCYEKGELSVPLEVPSVSADSWTDGVLDVSSGRGLGEG